MKSLTMFNVCSVMHLMATTCSALGTGGCAGADEHRTNWLGTDKVGGARAIRQLSQGRGIGGRPMVVVLRLAAVGRMVRKWRRTAGRRSREVELPGHMEGSSSRKTFRNAASI